MTGFRLLVVEDNPRMLDQLVKLLQEELPGSVVDAALSIDEALETINRAVLSGVAYDLAILDFKLPKTAGGHDEVDESVCRQLMTSMPEVVVGHITGFRGDKRMDEHNASVHPIGRRSGFFLDKKETEFASHLINNVHAALFGARIEREIEELFSSGEAPRPDGEGARATSPRRSSSISNRVVDLCLDIGSTWGTLNSMTQDRIRQFFLVDEGPTGTTVVLR